MKQKESANRMRIAVCQFTIQVIMACLTLTGCSRSPATPARCVLGNYAIAENAVPVDYLGSLRFSDYGKKLDVTYQRQVLTCSDQQRFVAIHLRNDGQIKRPDDPSKHIVLTDGATRYYALGVKFGSYKASPESPYYGFFTYRSGGHGLTFPLEDGFDPAQYKGVTIAAENPTKSSDEYVLFKVPSSLRQCKYTDSLTTCDITLAGKTDAPAIQHPSPQNSSAAGSVAREIPDRYASARGDTNTNAVSKVPKLAQPDESIVLPESAKEEAEKAFAKGYTYFIWPAKEGPFKVDSGLLSIPFFCIAKDKAQPYAAACQVFTMDYGSPIRDAGFQVMKLDGMTYSSRGRGEVLYIDAERNHLGKGSATVHLVDFETTTKQISNDMIVHIAGVIPQI